MVPRSIVSTAASIDATQRRLTEGIMIVTLMAWAVVVADLAIGGRPDPPTLRAAVTVLDGVAMFACIGLVIGYQSRSDHKSFLIWASIALALMANTFTRPSSRCWPL